MTAPKMEMMQWYATEGGRKCPMCGRYAKAEDLGDLSRWIGNARVSAYGHIEGRGCNKPAPPHPADFPRCEVRLGVAPVAACPR